MKWISAGLATIALLVVALVIGWSELGFKLGRMSALGDALAPLVGILSLAAVAAALYSVHLQSEALASHERSMTEQIELQRGALKKQEEEIKQHADALHEERVLQRQATLREGYAPVIAAVQRYLDLVENYMEWLRLNFKADKDQRKAQQHALETARVEVERAEVAPRLLDGDKTRGGVRWQLCREIRIEPWVDTQDFQQKWLNVIYYSQIKRLIALNKLIRSLEAEFGRPREETEADKRITSESLAMAKAAAEPVEAEIKTALDALLAQRKG